MTCTLESLRDSQATFTRIGRTFDAQFTGELADGCIAMERAGFGDALYRHWAAEQAKRADRLANLFTTRESAPLEKVSDTRGFSMGDA